MDGSNNWTDYGTLTLLTLKNVNEIHSQFCDECNLHNYAITQLCKPYTTSVSYDVHNSVGTSPPHTPTTYVRYLAHIWKIFTLVVK